MHRMLWGQLWAATHHMSAINAGRLSASQSRASQHDAHLAAFSRPATWAARDMQQEWWGACGGVDAHGSSGDSSVD